MSETFGTGASRFAVGDRVTTTRALRQDGTFPDPGVAVGQVLVEAGVAGQVMDIGVYLNEHLVYAVAFDSGRIVGCLERELETVGALRGVGTEIAAEIAAEEVASP